jgi:hypothetical protein
MNGRFARSQKTARIDFPPGKPATYRRDDSEERGVDAISGRIVGSSS